jgi:hypothetical protein
MADWEEMVTQVCVAGRPGAIDALHDQWGTIFTNARTVAESLHEGIKDLKGKWTGPAADDYLGKLEKIAKTIEDIEEKNKDVITMLQTSSQSLAAAQRNMPVPEYMLDNVQGRAKELNAANALFVEAGVIESSATTFGVSYLEYQVLPGSFRQGLIDSLGDFARETMGHLTSMVGDWIYDYTKQAEYYYNDVDSTYAQTTAIAADPSTVGTGITKTNAGLPTSEFPGGGGVGGVPGVGSGGFDPAAFDPAGTGSGLGSDPATGSGLDGYNPDVPPLSSLAGAGGGGLDGLGGTSGLGGLGGGLGGLAGSGLGAGSSAVGRPVGPPTMPFGMGAGAGGRGAAGRGRGVLGGGAGHGAGGHAPDDERGTWLTEDEDVWGGDTDAPPSVLS